MLFEERSYPRSLFEEDKAESINELVHNYAVYQLDVRCGKLSSLGAYLYPFALLFHKTNRAFHIFVSLAKADVLLSVGIPKLDKSPFYFENIYGQDLVL